MAAQHHEVDGGWGDPWPTFEDRLADVLSSNAMLTLMLWRSEPQRGEDPQAHLARVVDHGLARVRAGLDSVTNQILEFTVIRKVVTRDELAAEAEGVPAEEIDLRVRRLATLGLVECHGELLLVQDRIAKSVVPPLPVLRQSAHLVTSEQLRSACVLLGIPAPKLKGDLLEAVAEVLEDPERLHTALSELGPKSSQVFAALSSRSANLEWPVGDTWEDPPGSVGVWDLDLDPSLLVRGFGSNYGADRLRGRSALEDLTERCLIGKGHGYQVWMWMEAHGAVQGAMFPVWAVPGSPTVRAIDEPIGVAAGVVAAADLFAESLGGDEPAGKKTGDRFPMVKAIKAASVAVGIDPMMGSLLCHAVIELGLLVAVDRPRTGRGRSVEYPIAWVVNGERLAAWRSMPPELRWLGLVQAWLLSDSDQRNIVTPFMRRVLAISSLATLEPSQGIAATEVGAWLEDRQGSVDVGSRERSANGAADVVEDLVRLGICSGGASIGLSHSGWAMLSPHVAAGEPSSSLAEAFRGEATTFIVQPDHTIIASSDLPAPMLTMLMLIAERESDGGATVWRLSASRLTRSSRRLSSLEVVEFLREHSTVELSDNVVRFVEDHVVSTKVLSVGECLSYVAHEDPALVATAAGIGPAKLTVLAPGVAVSSLEPMKLRAALAARGVVVEVSGSSDGSGTSIDNGHLIAPSRQVYQPAASTTMIEPLPVPLGPGVVASLARHHGSSAAGSPTSSTPTPSNPTSSTSRPSRSKGSS